MPHLLFWLGAAAALIYLPFSPRESGFARSLFKTLSVALLALAALLAGAPLLLTLALALCAAGDYLLSRETEATFMMGVGAFAAGHLTYVALFLTRSESNLALLGDAPISVICLIALGIGMTVLLTPRAGDLKGPVLAYIPIILAMGLAALTLPGTGALIWVWPAAVAFMASDTILATEKFLLSDNHPARRLTPFLIWPLYWGAQAGFFAAFT